jgi:hypothetical protein
MAILITNDGDKVVDTIAQRDLIVNKFDGMNVVVRDSIADVRTGGGEAQYTWNKQTNQWMLTWKTSVDNLNFTTETKTIANGKVTASYFPSNGVIWDGFVTNEFNDVVADISNPIVTAQEIDLGSQVFDGNTLTFTYGYGLIESAIYAASDRNWTVKTANYTAGSGDRIFADTSAGVFTITLPAAPLVGMFVKIADYSGTFATNPITIARNGSNILGMAEDRLIDINQYALMLVYSGAAKGWIYGI